MSEGLEVLDALNEVITDKAGRPLQNVRVRHSVVLDDPFPDPPQLADHVPERSPEPVFAAARTPCPRWRHGTISFSLPLCHLQNSIPSRQGLTYYWLCCLSQCCSHQATPFPCRGYSASTAAVREELHAGFHGGGHHDGPLSCSPSH